MQLCPSPALNNSFTNTPTYNSNICLLIHNHSLLCCCNILDCSDPFSFKFTSLCQALSLWPRQPITADLCWGLGVYLCHTYFGLLLLCGIDNRSTAHFGNFAAFAIERPAADFIPKHVFDEEDAPIKPQHQLVKQFDVLQQVIIWVAGHIERQPWSYTLRSLAKKFLLTERSQGEPKRNTDSLLRTLIKLLYNLAVAQMHS